MFLSEYLFRLPYPLAHASFNRGMHWSAFIFYKLKCTVTAETWWELGDSPSHTGKMLLIPRILLLCKAGASSSEWDQTSVGAGSSCFSQMPLLMMPQLLAINAWRSATHKVPAYASSFIPVW